MTDYSKDLEKYEKRLKELQDKLDTAGVEWQPNIYKYEDGMPIYSDLDVITDEIEEVKNEIGYILYLQQLEKEELNREDKERE